MRVSSISMSCYGPLFSVIVSAVIKAILSIVLAFFSIVLRFSSSELKILGLDYSSIRVT